MNINAEVITIQNGSTFKKTDGGTYKGTLLVYRDIDKDKIEEAKLHENVLKFNKSIAKSLSESKAGDSITIIKEKNTQGYWNITDIQMSGKVVPIFKEGNPNSNKPNYMNDSDRQLLIVKQSSLKAAVDYHTGMGTNEDSDVVLALADKFVKWVFSKEEVNLDKIQELPVEDDDLVA